MAVARSPSASDVAAEPIFAECDALRAGRGGSQRGKCCIARVRLGQEAQRDPAGEEFGLDIGVAGHQAHAWLGDLVGDAGLSVVQCAAAIDAPLRPPIVEVEQDVRLARRIEQHLPGFLAAVLVLGATQPLDTVEPQAGVGLDRVRRNRVEQLAGIAAAFDHGDARRDLLLLVGRQQLGHAQRRPVAPTCRPDRAAVDARAMVSGVSMLPKRSRIFFSTAALSSWSRHADTTRPRRLPRRRP